MLNVASQPVLNLFSNPAPSSATHFGRANDATVEYIDGRGMHVTCAAGGTADSGLAFASGIPSVLNLGPVTISADVTAIVTDAYCLSSQGAGFKFAKSPFVRVEAGATRRLTFTATVTDATAGRALYVLRTTASLASEFYVTRILVEYGPIAHPYGDGDSPAGRWLAAPGDSESVFYPQ